MRLLIKGLYLGLLFCLGLFSYAGEEAKKEDPSKSLEGIKEVLENDLLADEIKKRDEEKKQAHIEESNQLIKRYFLPKESEIWSVFSEVYLVKNAAKLSFDFIHPEYDLEKSFIQLLEELGFYQQKVKVLAINNAELTHFSLPANDYEIIVVVSIPFVRSLNLSKQEIALLMFEDFLRQDLKLMKDFVLTKELKELLGQNMYPKMVTPDKWDEVIKKYDNFLNVKGYSFQDQYEVTKKMKMYLRAHQLVMQRYVGLLSKIDSLQKGNTLYKNYSKIYPAPEIQLKWLKEF